ncbi:hypothetical protein L1887_22826 [Cichorium endivia]|nr:hypothetical protein L1887_22826 [Cichorium endivia]
MESQSCDKSKSSTIDKGTSHLVPVEWSQWTFSLHSGQPIIWRILDPLDSISFNKFHLLPKQVYDADFVILCVGRFKDVPNIPAFAPGTGPEVFQGKVIHSMDYTSMDHKKAEEFVKGKRVVVVGFQKQGLDIAMECSSVNGADNPCTVVYRKDRWKLSNFAPWGIPLQYLYLNRFSELMVHKPGEGFLLRMLATLLSPIVSILIGA